MGDTPDFSALSVATNDLLILNTSGLGNALTPGGFVDCSLAAYSSLTLISNSGVPILLQLDYHQAVTVGGVADTVQYTEYLSSIDTTLTPEWNLPIHGGSVRITNLSAAAINLVGYGSSRLVDHPIIMGNTWQTRSYSRAFSAVSGTVVTIPNTDGGPDSIAMNGLVNYRAASFNTFGLFGYRYVTRTLATRDVYFAPQTAAGSVVGTTSFPPGLVFPLFLPSATNAASTISLDLTPVTP